jgi:hypothetical protein
MDAATKQATEELKAAVGDLQRTVQGWRDEMVDRETVERVVQEVLSRSNATNGYNPLGAGASGFLPGDTTDAPGVAGSFASVLDVGAPNRQALAGRGRDRFNELLTASPGKIERATGKSAERVREWHEAADALVLTSAYLDKPAQELEMWTSFRALTQAMDTGTANEGQEFVPRELSGSLIERINLQLKVAALFPGVDMPTNPFDIPGFAVTRKRTGTKIEETADTGQGKFQLLTPASRKITLTAQKLGARVILSKELEEDSIIAMLPFLRGELIDYLAGDMEDAILNGDNTNPHQDSDVTDFTDPADPRTAWNGLRLLAQAAQKTDLANAAPTVANSIRVNRKKMGRYGVNPADLAHVVSISAYMQLLADSSVLTLEKYGPEATILRGELGSVDGSPIVVSEYVREDLNATGVHDGVTTNRTVVLTVNRRGFLTGQRRAVTVDVLRELYAESDQDLIIASMRRAFTPRFPSTEGIVALAFNAAS